MARVAMRWPAGFDPLMNAVEAVTNIEEWADIIDRSVLIAGSQRESRTLARELPNDYERLLWGLHRLAFALWLFCDPSASVRPLSLPARIQEPRACRP